MSDDLKDVFNKIAAEAVAQVGNFNCPIEQPVTIPPALIGNRTKAWQLRIQSPTEIETWLIEAPWAHPLWHSYMLILGHTRPTLGVPNSDIFLAGATHEIWLMALDPKADRTAIIKGMTKNLGWLRPQNFGAQFLAVSDQEAKLRIGQTVQMICDEVLNPDTDFLRQWIALFGDNMIKPEFRPR